MWYGTVETWCWYWLGWLHGKGDLQGRQGQLRAECKTLGACMELMRVWKQTTIQYRGPVLSWERS